MFHGSPPIIVSGWRRLGDVRLSCWDHRTEDDTGVYLNQPKKNRRHDRRKHWSQLKRSTQIIRQARCRRRKRCEESVQLLGIGVKVFHVAIADLLLGVLPEARVEQVAMMLEEGLADARLAQQETLEMALTQLVEHYGWEGLAQKIKINCSRVIHQSIHR